MIWRNRKPLPLISVCLVAAIALGSSVAFIWRSETAQDREIARAAMTVAVVAVSTDTHIQAADKAFAALHDTLDDHRKILSATRLTLVAVQTTQVAIRADATRLTKAVDELTKAIRERYELAESRRP